MKLPSIQQSTETVKELQTFFHEINILANTVLTGTVNHAGLVYLVLDQF